MTCVGFDAVVLDCDGTLVDSERLSRAAMAEVLAEDGYTVTDDDHAAVVGRAWPDIRSHLVQQVGYDDAQVEAYRHRVRRAFQARLGDLRAFDDVLEVLDQLRGRNVPVGVCTSSGRAHLDEVLALPELAGRFAVTVTREDTDEHKPRPAPYRLAAARLGVVPGACVVVEDTPAGIAAARAAGMSVVGVDRGQGLDVSAADVVVDVVDLDALVTAHGRDR